MNVKEGRQLDDGSFEVSVSLLLSYESVREARSAVMTFVKEDGEWLILREGF